MRYIGDTIDTKQEVLLMQFTISHTTSLLYVSYLDDLSQIVTNIREIILQTTRVFFRRAWWKEVAPVPVIIPVDYAFQLSDMEQYSTERHCRSPKSSIKVFKESHWSVQFNMQCIYLFGVRSAANRTRGAQETTRISICLIYIQ